MKYFMEDYGVPTICGMIGAFIGIAIAYVAGWL